MKLSVVTTLYYSEAFLPSFYERIVSSVAKITDDYELLFINDGSPDNSKQIVLDLQSKDAHVVLVDLSRNFGHHKAIRTGLSLAKGDYVFLIDSDLEEDPGLLPVFWEEINRNNDIDMVYGIQKKRKGDWFERLSGKLYYAFLALITANTYPPDTLTARLMSRQYLEGLQLFAEKEADLWGLFHLNGFQQSSVLVSKGSKGSSTYTLRKKIKLAIGTITTLTYKPLYFIAGAGAAVTFLAILYSLYILIRYFVLGVIGEVSLVLASIWLLGGLILVSLGVIGIYLSKVVSEVKSRPLGVIRRIYYKHTSYESD